MCAQNKKLQIKLVGLLQMLPTHLLPCSMVSMDFIVDHLCSMGCSMLLVVVDLLTKMAYFVRQHNSSWNTFSSSTNVPLKCFQTVTPISSHISGMNSTRLWV